jgi:hypothetical protein
MKNVPNPFSNSTNIQIKATIAGTYQFLVHNALGQKVHETSVNLEVGENNIPFQGAYLQNGLYFYSISKENRVMTDKMVIHH